MRKGAAEVANPFRATATDGLNVAADVYPGYKALVIAGGEVRTMTWGFPVTLIGKRGPRGLVTIQLLARAPC